MEGKYCASPCGDGVFEGEFETIEEATKEYPGCDIGIYRDKHQPKVNIDSIIEDLEERAEDDVGQIAIGWLDGIPRESFIALEKKFQDLLDKWLEENNATPHFYRVEDIK